MQIFAYCRFQLTEGKGLSNKPQTAGSSPVNKSASLLWRNWQTQWSPYILYHYLLVNRFNRPNEEGYPSDKRQVVGSTPTTPKHLM